jgi:transcriptional antiterminator NusG
MTDQDNKQENQIEETQESEEPQEPQTSQEPQTIKIKENKPEEGAVIISDKSSDNANWYVVHTYAGHEKKVATSLKQRVQTSNFDDRIFQVFIPHQQKIVISEGKKRSVNERLFPGYVVVLMEMSDDAWLLVRSTPGVTGFVGMGSTPTPLPEQEVKTLMKFAKMEAPKFEAKYTVGDSVKIIDGPFRDILGKVEEVNEDQGKVKVLISSFGREVPVELDFVQVQSI